MKVACKSPSHWSVPLSGKKCGHLKPTYTCSINRIFFILLGFFTMLHQILLHYRHIFINLLVLPFPWMGSKGKKKIISFLTCSFCENYPVLTASGIKPAGLEGCKEISEFYGRAQCSTGTLLQCSCHLCSRTEQLLRA